MGKYKEALLLEQEARAKQVEKDYDFDADDRNFHEAQDVEDKLNERHDPVEPR